MKINSYFKEDDFQLFLGDCLEVLPKIKAKSIDLIFADPPYFISNGGITCKSGKMASVNKGKWDESAGNKKDYEFTLNWLKKCRRVLSDDGSIWISGTLHNIYKIGYCLEKLKFDIINEIIWFKPNAPPNLSCKYFTHSHETLIWARKKHDSKHTFNYKDMKRWDYSNDMINKEDKQMRSVWSIPTTSKSEKRGIKHPTQKPIELLKRIIVSSSNKNETILDPFNGSGTTGLVSSMLKRKYIGIDKKQEYLDMTIKRYNQVLSRYL
jgi:site-specific DNA-methyltransferase (adenine-specific)